MSHSSTASAASDPPPRTKSADAQAARPESACREGREDAAAAHAEYSDASLISRTARTRDAGAVATHSPDDASIPQYHVQSIDGSYKVFGVDAIWHNQYAGPKSDFLCIRKQFDADINLMILKVARHVAQGVYTVISMNATPHMLTVICACESMQADFPEDMWDEPSR